MPTFLRYLASLVLHLAWRRAGRGGPVPPIRLPGKAGKNGKAVDLPVIGTWQLMAAVWLLKQVWNRYGHEVKGRLASHTNDLARRAATFLPDTTVPATVPATAPAAPNVGTPNFATPSAPIPTPVPTPTPRVTPNLNTQVLPSQTPTAQAPTQPTTPQTSSPTSTQNGAPTKLPSGSLLNKLRGRS